MLLFLSEYWGQWGVVSSVILVFEPFVFISFKIKLNDGICRIYTGASSSRDLPYKEVFIFFYTKPSWHKIH